MSPSFQIMSDGKMTNRIEKLAQETLWKEKSQGYHKLRSVYWHISNDFVTNKTSALLLFVLLFRRPREMNER
jgi:hypothetical protein